MIKQTSMSLVAFFVVVWAASADMPAGRVRFEIRHTRAGQAGPITSPDGKLTVKVVAPLAARLVETVSGKEVGSALTHSRRRPAMRIHTWAFSGDGKLLATASSAGRGEDTVGEVRVWEVPSGKLLATATDAQHDLGRVHTIAFARDNRTVQIGCDEISGK